MSKEASMAIDFTSPTGQVRLLIADVDEGNQLLTDLMVAGFLAMHDQDVRLAAAAALDSIASSEVLVSKKIRTQDLSTDGPAVAAELRAQAQGLRDQVALEDSDGVFDVVDTMPASCRPGFTDRGYPVWGL
jgi:hypothetical protein